MLLQYEFKKRGLFSMYKLPTCHDDYQLESEYVDFYENMHRIGKSIP